jgi:hypothetical protein
MSENKVIFLFQNIRQVILAEQWCVDNKLPVKVIPVPKPFSTECGMCLEISKEDEERMEVFAKEKGLITKIIH